MRQSRERDHIRQLVSSYLDGELPPEDAMWVGRQISEDPRYAEVYRAYRGIRMDIRALPVPEVPLSVSAAIRAYTAAAPPRRPVVSLRARVARITTAAVSIAAAIVAIFTHGFGVPLQFAHNGVPPANRTPIAVNVANGPTVATLANTKLAYNDVAQLHFSSAMDETTVKQAVHFAPITDQSHWLPPSQLMYTPDTATLSTLPLALVPSTDYRVTIPRGLRDLQGNEVQNTSFDFSVGAAPPPVAVIPPTEQPTAIAAATPTDVAVSAIVPAPTVAPETVAATPEPDATSVVTDAPADQPVATATVARSVVTRPTIPAARPTSAPVAPPAASATSVPVPPSSTATNAMANGAASATAVTKPAPTAVPATATTAPVPTPEPVAATPTAVPLPTATTGVPVAPSFQSAYAQNANRLGAPTGVASTFSGTQLNFTNGVMVYVPGRSFYVIYAGGSWSTVANPGGSSAAVPNATGGYVPGGAYGAAWTNAKLSGKLGYATSTQESSYAGSSQSFDNGVILKVGGDVYVLFNNGAYQLFGA